MDEKYLLKIAVEYYTELNEKLSQCEFFTLENDLSVRYMCNFKKPWVYLLCGPMVAKLKKDKNVAEKDKIRSNAKNYYKLFYKNEVLMKVESYVNGRIDSVYLCYYFDYMRILKPFTADGGYYPTYSLITFYSQNNVIREIWLSEAQIILENYSYNKNYIDYEYANLAPYSKTHKIISYSRGIIGENSEYSEKESFCWYNDL